MVGMEKIFVHFMQVAYHGGITQASAALDITQPAISKSIKTLEQRYGTALFVRRSRGVELTEAGELMLERCIRIESEMKAIESDIETLFCNKDVIRIGAGPAWVLPIQSIISDFHLRFPKAHIVIESGSICQLVPRMLSGDLDIALGGEEGLMSSKSNELSFIPLIDNRICIVAHESHHLANVKTCQIRELANYPWVGYQQSSEMLEQVNRLLIREQVAPVQFTLETEFLDVATTLVSANDALMCISHTLLEKVKPLGIVEIPVKEPIWSFHIGAWVNPRYQNQELVAEFIKAISAQAELYMLNHPSPLLT